jgi:Bacterial Ig-like domain (group 2)
VARHLSAPLLACALALALAACADRGGAPLLPPPPGAPAELAALSCRADVRGGTVRCADATGVAGANGLIIGGQHTYVEVTAENPEYDGEIFRFDVSIGNLIPQPLGTTDGTTPSGTGVRIFFHEGPTVTAGEGIIFVGNPTDVATFTGQDQPYFEYSGADLGADSILSQNETSSSKGWEIAVQNGIETFDFVLLVSADVPFPNGWVDLTPPADTLSEGGTQPLSATVRTRTGVPVPGAAVTWATSDAAVATVDASGVVTAVAPGTATITATSGARSGSASIAVCPSLAVGGVETFDMPAGSSLCLGGGAEYTVVPVNVAEAGSVSLAVTGAGIVPVSGAPSPVRVPLASRLSAAFRARGALRPDDAFETRLRRREQAAAARIRAGGGLSARRSAAPPRGPGRAITPGIPAVGALMTLNVETDNVCGSPDPRTGRVVAVGTHVIVIADTLNPSGGLTAADYAAIADSFDAQIFPTVTGAFGAPADIDGNDRVIAFYTSAVNALTPPGSSAYIGGFFFARDLYTAAQCPSSNVGEMFYMLAADPAGTVNGNERDADFVEGVTLGTLAHEFQHLVNASRRMYVNTPWNGSFEEVWLNEGLSHVAEELMFYQGAGVAPLANLDMADVFDGGQRQAAFFKYADSNYGRLRQWLLSPDASGPFQDDDDLATRGASWAFLRYAADRVGASQDAFWSALVNTQERGLANVQVVLATDPLPWYRDFAAAMYADDAGGTPAAIYTQPSWNFRDLYAGIDYTGDGVGEGYQLAVRDPANGVADSFTLVEGGAAAYLRMGVSPGAFAGVTVLSGGAAPASTVRLAVIRRE